MSSTLILIGCVLLSAYAAHVFGRRIHVPRVTLLLLIGVVVGPAGLDVVPDVAETAFPLITHLSLAMVGFLLGERLALRELRGEGRVAGGYWSARLSAAGSAVARRIGWCLLPQAGVAVGLTLLAVERLPETRAVTRLFARAVAFLEVAR